MPSLGLSFTTVGLLCFFAINGQSQTLAPMFSPDFPSAVVYPSPNFERRRYNQGVSMLVIHYTATETAEEALQTLTNPNSSVPVSTHYLVHENGTVYQLVPESMRAHQAGAGFWRDVFNDANSVSIGIEIQNPGDLHNEPPFVEPQIQTVISLCKSIVGRYNIRPEMVVGHEDYAPTRKPDPGHSFPWKKLYDAGVGLWAEPAPIISGPVLKVGDQSEGVRDMQQLFSDLGYGIPRNGVFENETLDVVVAFQKHWRQEKYDGVADNSTIETLKRVLAKVSSPDNNVTPTPGTTTTGNLGNLLLKLNLFVIFMTVLLWN